MWATVGFSVFPPSTKSNIFKFKFHASGKQWMKSHSVDIPLQFPIYFIFIYLFICLLILTKNPFCFPFSTSFCVYVFFSFQFSPSVVSVYSVCSYFPFIR